METPTQRRALAQENSIYHLTGVSCVQKYCRMLRAPLLQNTSSTFEMVHLVHRTFSELVLSLLFYSKHSAMAVVWMSLWRCCRRLQVLMCCFPGKPVATHSNNVWPPLKCFSESIVRHSGKPWKMKGEIKIAFHLKCSKVAELKRYLSKDIEMSRYTSIHIYIYTHIYIWKCNTIVPWCNQKEANTKESMGKCWVHCTNHIGKLWHKGILSDFDERWVICIEPSRLKCFHK